MRKAQKAIDAEWCKDVDAASAGYGKANGIIPKTRTRGYSTAIARGCRPGSKPEDGSGLN